MKSFFAGVAFLTRLPVGKLAPFDAADVAEALASRDARIAELEAELAALKGEPAAAN